MVAFLLGGLAITIQLLVASLVVGLALGLTLAVARLSRYLPLRWLATAYIETMRGIPLLVLLLFIYFGLQGIVGVAWRIPEFWAATAAFGLCYGAYLAEVFRAGVESVDVGQTEAARALGLSSGQTLRHIVLPQAVRNILPALVNESVALLKDTSLASVIAIPEITQRARLEVARTYDTFRVWGSVAVIYLLLTFGLSLVARRLEQRGRRVGTHDSRSESL
jgi:His/Glu/Gln/Arg/opine family amino acid ABC transporter permease subunit